MKALRKALRITGWSVAALVGLGVATYLIVVAINWSDRSPSATALQFASQYRDRPAVADADNGFIYVMGFGVPAGESPFEMGSKRIAWWKQDSGRNSRLDFSKDPMGEPPAVQAVRSKAIQDFIAACRQSSSACPGALRDGGSVFQQWERSESWLLPRYLELIRHRGWLETVPFSASTPLPAYGRVVDGQMLLFLDAQFLAQRGDYAGVKSLLDEDLSFWRKVLESSDILITKMIATACINRHFELGGLVLREIPPKHVLSAMPAGWGVPVSDAERSMRRCLVGEWIYMSESIRESDRASAIFGQESFVSRVKSRLADPLFRRQDTINKQADYLLQMSELLNAPLDHYEDAVNQSAALRRRTQSQAFPPHSLYNIVGQILSGVGAFDFGAYARRVSDLEGVRRAAVLAVTLYSEKVEATQVSAALSTSTLREPYHNRPFEWDGTGDAILFRGLEIADRGVHHIYY
jgi:hypothetical protein